MVDRDGLAGELKAFRKGRAAQHPHFVQRLGSRLRRLTGITEADPLPAARAKLRDWVEESLRDQPADLNAGRHGRVRAARPSMRHDASDYAACRAHGGTPTT